MLDIRFVREHPEDVYKRQGLCYAFDKRQAQAFLLPVRGREKPYVQTG